MIENRKKNKDEVTSVFSWHWKVELDHSDLQLKKRTPDAELTITKLAQLECESKSPESGNRKTDIFILKLYLIT